MVACAPVQRIQDSYGEMKAQQQLEQYRKNMAAGFFETVIEQSKQILAESETDPPADVALYSLGEAYANHDFAGRDYALSTFYFEKLITNFPDSVLTLEAKTYINLFKTITAREKETAAVKEELMREEKKATAAQILPQKEIIVAPEKKVAVPHRVVVGQNFEEAAKKNRQIVEKLGLQKPADEALYNLGLIYAHVDNPMKDYKKSKIYFHVLATQFPDSDFIEEARIWLGLFETLEKIQQIDVEIEQQKKQLIR